MTPRQYSRAFRALLLNHASEFAMERAGIPMQRLRNRNTPPEPSDGAVGPSNTEKSPAVGTGLMGAVQGGKPGISPTITKGGQ